MDLAMKCNYLATSKGTQPNVLGSDPRRFQRISAHLGNQMYPSFITHALYLPFFVLEINRYRGTPGAAVLFKMGQVLVKTAKRLKSGFQNMRKRTTP